MEIIYYKNVDFYQIISGEKNEIQFKQKTMGDINITCDYCPDYLQ